MFGKSYSPDEDIPDLSGKVILVTGGNTGIGQEAVFQLSKHKPLHIYLAARTESKAQEAISSIKSEVPEAPITFLPLDLASLASVNAAAETINKESTRLDILINNAGIMATPQGVTADGIEIQLGTNHVGHFQLVAKLLPLLQKTAKLPDSDVRIVNLTSAAHAMAPSGGINLEDPSIPDSGAWARYAQSKLANILFTRELAKRYPNIKSVAVHPGLVQTQLWSQTKQNNIFVRYITSLASFSMSTTAQGAYNTLWAATSKDIVSGAFYTPVGVKSSGRPMSRNDTLGANLWAWSEEQIKSKGF